MNIEKNKSLFGLNTFGMKVKAEQFLEITSPSELELFGLSVAAQDLTLIMGGGSNMLLTKDVSGLVLKISIKGIEVIDESETHVIVRCAAGENWHQFVMTCIENDWGGLENMSLIPGQVGTAPVQNIGAYGVELKDTFVSLTGYDLQQKTWRSFNNEACEFGYRDSIFKRALKKDFIISSVDFRLSKKNHHTLHLEYGAIKDELEAMQITAPTIKDVSNAVISIRRSKLPDPNEIGNSGSFFKNPTISEEEYILLQQEFPQLKGHHTESGVKLAAGWLIEQAGWKGYRKGDAGVHSKQALVLVNYGNASGEEVRDLAHTIIRDVASKFGVELEPEVNIL